MSTTSDSIHIDWLAGRFLPTFQAPDELTAYNVHQLDYDLQLSIATLVGLINRTQASVYLDWREYDLFWLREVLGHVSSTISTFRGEAILYDLLQTYRDRVDGYVIYDPMCIDSVNVATMLGSQRNGFVVSPVLAERLREQGYDLAIIADMRDYSWGSRSQIYRWALQHLFAGATSGLVAGLNPETAMGIRPYLVATRAFIYWLHPLDIVPRKSQGWLPERQVLKSILRACPPGSIHLGWFLQEGSGVTLTSQHAIPVVPSDYVSNLETWSGVAYEPVSPPLKAQPTALVSQPKVYVAFTMSEGDNLQYIQEPMLRHWHNPERGSIPIGWPMALTLQQAAPAMWGYYVRTASANDEFIAGPSGLGYSYLSKWPRHKLTGYLAQTGRAMQNMQISLLEILDSNFWWHPFLIYRAVTMGAGMILSSKQVQQQVTHELQTFGLKGVLNGGGLAQASWRYSGATPILENIGIASSVKQAVALIRRATPAQRPSFLNAYVLAWRMGPAELKEVAQELGSEYEIVTPGTLISLMDGAADRG
jgi:hypothetical protein